MDPWFLLPFPTSAFQNASAPPCAPRGPTAGCQVVQVVIDAWSGSRGTEMTFPAQLDLIKQLWSDKPVLFIHQPISTQTIHIQLKQMSSPCPPKKTKTTVLWARMTFAKLEDGGSGTSSRRPRVEASLHLVCNACPVLATMLPGNEPELKPQKIETEVFMLKKQPQNNYNKQPRQPLCCSLTVALHWLCCSCAIEQVHLVCFKLVQLVS